MIQYGEKLRKKRLEAHLTQYEIAAELDFDRSKVSKIENGKQACRVDEYFQILDIIENLSKKN
ncbi:MAG: helix-turn-helix domain-containing protein [Lachnospiraceae bacterium]|nr:helix-turn-helix domain-containing protein [Lachnospiraceae bacterium]